MLGAATSSSGSVSEPAPIEVILTHRPTKNPMIASCSVGVLAVRSEASAESLRLMMMPPAESSSAIATAIFKISLS